MRIFPIPKFMEENADRVLYVNEIKLDNNDVELDVKKDFFDFVGLFGVKEGEEVNIEFCANYDMEAEEYSLVIDNGIKIEYSSLSGKVYALQTLKQIIFQCHNKLPNVVIKDKPTKKLRAMLVDVGRYFFSVDDIKKIIRRMAMHKLNLLHFHITEDQGWRVDIEKYPLLTQKGSIRKRTNFNFKRYEGHYTKDEVREIVRYAHAFGIKVMPEYDVPGHNRSALACYHWLGCFDRELPVAYHWGVKHDVLCAGKESTIEFVKDIIDELCELFPDEYFHIGGDEVPKHRWERCPHCQAKMKELGITNEEKLQYWFMNQIKDYCCQKGKTVFMWGWDFKEKDTIDDDMCFTKYEGTEVYKNDYLDTVSDAYYIDFPYGYTSLKKCADHKLLSDDCLGPEATLWTEHIPNLKKADKMMFPRLIAVSQTGWNGNSSWETVSPMVDYYYSYLDKNGIGYSGIKKANPSKVRGKLQGIFFEKRQLTWGRTANYFDDKKVDRMAKKINQKK